MGWGCRVCMSVYYRFRNEDNVTKDFWEWETQTLISEARLREHHSSSLEMEFPKSMYTRCQEQVLWVGSYVDGMGVQPLGL